MKKKKYVAPKITVIEMESSQIMVVSGWTPDGDIKNGFSVVEEGEDDYDDNDF